ncbi:MAG: hypothetical protein AB7K24_17665 [Gemmataceae bacterium]
MRPLGYGVLAVLMVLGSVAVPQLAGQAPKKKETKEPPQIFYLEFNGKKIPVELDKPIKTDAFGGANAVTLRVEPYRVFPYGGLSFHYPREYSFEVSIEDEVSSWTLDGTDCILMVHRFHAEIGHQEAVDAVETQLLAAYKKHKIKKSAVKLNIRGKEIKGRSIVVELVEGVSIRQDLYSFPAGKSAVILIIQDSPGDDGKPSADWTRAVKLLGETFRAPTR